jgi:hypothetical protein
MLCIQIFVEIIIYIGMVNTKYKILLAQINNGQEYNNIKFLELLKFDCLYTIFILLNLEILYEMHINLNNRF